MSGTSATTFRTRRAPPYPQSHHRTGMRETIPPISLDHLAPLDTLYLSSIAKCNVVQIVGSD